MAAFDFCGCPEFRGLLEAAFWNWDPDNFRTPLSRLALAFGKRAKLPANLHFASAYLKVRPLPDHFACKKKSLVFLAGPGDLKAVSALRKSLRLQRNVLIAEIDYQVETYRRERRLGRPLQILIANLTTKTLAYAGEYSLVCNSLADLLGGSPPGGGGKSEEQLMEFKRAVAALVAPTRFSETEFSRYVAALAGETNARIPKSK